jgi:hypothetical protein
MEEPPEDRRISIRINQSQTVRIRPADSKHAEVIHTTLNVSWARETVQFRREERAI